MGPQCGRHPRSARALQRQGINKVQGAADAVAHHERAARPGRGAVTGATPYVSSLWDRSGRSWAPRTGDLLDVAERIAKLDVETNQVVLHAIRDQHHNSGFLPPTTAGSAWPRAPSLRRTPTGHLADRHNLRGKRPLVVGVAGVLVKRHELLGGLGPARRRRATQVQGGACAWLAFPGSVLREKPASSPPDRTGMLACKNSLSLTAVFLLEK